MTQPKKGSDDTRDQIFKVRLSAAEKKIFQELADQAGLTTSDLFRVKLIGGKPQTKKATPDRAILIRLQAELNKVGNNANQIARALNRRQDSDNLTGLSMEDLNHVLQGIKTLTTHIAKELGHGD